LVGLLLVLGDVVTTSDRCLPFVGSAHLGLPKRKLARLGVNLLFDMAIGVIRLFGDAADFAFRSNSRNLRIIRLHFEEKHRPHLKVIEG